jgi:hypothetical protein
MAQYLVIYTVDGTRHSDRVKATSSENVERKLRGWYPNCLKFEIVSIQPKVQKQVHGSIVSVPTFKQFTCSFSVMNGSEAEVRQIALHALDKASAKETLQHTYPGIIVSTIRIVEAI